MTERELLIKGLEQICPEVYSQTVDNFLKFSDMLLEKNKVMNLTAITEPMEVISRHFLDCAMIAPDIISEEKVIDIGTGAGFPGLPLAILCQDTEFVLIDALRKRIDFLNEVISQLGLKNVTAIHARAEELKERQSFSAAVSRAVADLSVLSELTLPLVKVGGKFISMKAQDCQDEVIKATKAIEILGGAKPIIKTYTVVESDIVRAKVEINKIKDTPSKYPRRFAKISAAPLGGK